MIAFEFQTNIKDGVIEVPPEYRDQLKGVVRVTIVAQLQRKPQRIIARLLENPINDPSFTPLTRDEIYQDRG